MSRSNAAEAWYPEPESTRSSVAGSAVGYETPLDLLPPPELTRPLWKSLVGNFRDTFAPEKLPPLQLTSRPVDVGLLLSDRISLPWFRTIFTNIGDVISPEVLPPLELEARPVDVGELITDQLSHFWWASLLRNLADRVAPESQPVLQLTAKPINDIIPKNWILLPMWSEVIDGPKIFYPDPKPSEAPRPVNLKPEPVAEQIREVIAHDPVAAGLVRDIRRSRIRQRIWIGVAAVQAVYMILLAFGKL